MQLCHERSHLNTAALLEHFAERNEGRALRSLAVASLPGDEAIWAVELADVIRRLGERTEDQQLAELSARAVQGELSDAEKALLRELHRRKAER